MQQHHQQLLRSSSRVHHHHHYHPASSHLFFESPYRVPEKWWGKYQQSGLGKVVISENSMTTKGVCTNQTKDFFIFFNRDEDCYYCLVMLRMHRNVIQYRESHCVVSNPQNVCFHVQLETPMHTLVRENADAIKCPLSGVYFFSINDPMKEPCSRMDSVAKPCVGRTRYQMVLKNCNHGFNIRSDELYMECIGQWRESSDSYLYVRLSSPGLSRHDDDTHRCLRYQSKGLDVEAAMSADATCQGLRSSSDGPYVLRLLRNVTAMSDDSCQFPEWLDDITWFDNDKNVKVRLDREAGILTEYKRFSWEASSSSSSSSSPSPRWMPYEQSVELKCFSTNDEETDEFLAVVGRNYQCDVEIQCLKLSKHTRFIFSIAKSDPDAGKLIGDPSTCLKIKYGPRQLLFADRVFSVTSACSSPGIYHSAHSRGCSKRVLVGCQRDSQILMDHNCQKQTETFECVSSWNEKKKIFIAAKKTRLGSLHCFVVDANLGILQYNKGCNRQGEHPESLIYPVFEPCHPHPPYVLFTAPSNSHARFVRPEDDEESRGSGGFDPSEDSERMPSEGKREKHIYLTNNNPHVTVEGVWEVKNMNREHPVVHQISRSPANALSLMAATSFTFSCLWLRV